MRDMRKGRTLLMASGVAAAMAVVGVMAVSAAGRSAGPANFLAAASPAPTNKSNETSAHEATEAAARETAENNGTFHGGPGGPAGASNETGTPANGGASAPGAGQNARRRGAILLMVKAGSPVDEGTDSLTALLEPGDTIIDGGNSLFHDTRRRATAAARAGLGFLGMGVSGGEEGALRGPSLMPGGTRESYEHVAEMLTAIAAKVDGVPCCTYIGADGAGHFVKIVHNGIEYADIQLIAESYDLLRSALGLTPAELAAIFRGWNEGRLQSYLIEITANVLAKSSDGTDEALVDAIEDEAEQKGTGRWTTDTARDLSMPLTRITLAV